MKSRVCNIECFEGRAFVRIRSPFYVFGENFKQIVKKIRQKVKTICLKVKNRKGKV